MNYVGVQLAKGDHVAEVYSPALLTAFSSASSNGTLPLTLASVDFESSPTLTLEVTVTDSMNFSDTKVITIAVSNVDEPPELDETLILTVDENTGNGTTIGTVTLTQSDAGDPPTFQITGVRVKASLRSIQIRVR